MTDTLPLGVTVDHTFVTTNGWTVVPGPVTPGDQQTLTFTLPGGLLANTAGNETRGVAPVIEFEVNLDSGIADDELLINNSEVESETPDPNPDNDSDDADLTINREVDTTVSKKHALPTHGIDEFEIGEEITFTIAATNAGPSQASSVTVTETMPKGLKYTGFTGTQWSLASQNPDPATGGATTELVFTYAGKLNPGEETSNLIIATQVTVEVDSGNDVTNIVCVEVAEENTAADTCSDDIIPVVPIADLTIGKEVITPADEIKAGLPVTWLITPRNLGPSVSHSSVDTPIQVVDTLPAGIVSLVSNPSNADWIATTSNDGGWAEATAGDTITWAYTGSAFAVGAEPDIEISAMIDPAWHSGEIANIAEVIPGSTRDQNPKNNEDDSVIDPADYTKLQIFKNRMVEIDGEWVAAGAQNPVPPVIAGTTVTYRVDLINEGPANARNATAVDLVPAGLSDPVLSEVAGGGSWSADEVTECESGITENVTYEVAGCLTMSLADPLLIGVENMASTLVTFKVDQSFKPDATLENWVQGRATNVPEEERPDDLDSTDSKSYADLSITKAAAVESVVAGDTIDYTLVVENVGPSATRGPVKITDMLPMHMTYVDGTAHVQIANGELQQIDPTVKKQAQGDKLTWNVIGDDSELKIGEKITVTLTVLTAEDVINADGAVNTATVSSPEDRNPSNNEDKAKVVIDPLVTLVTTKNSVGAFLVDEIGQYQITVTNLGPTVDPGPVFVVDELPRGLTFESSPDANHSIEGNTVTWTLTDGLEVGETATFTLFVKVGKAALPTVTNVVDITTDVENLTPESVLTDEDVVEVALKPVDPNDRIPSTGGAAPIGLAIMGVLLLATGGVILTRRRNAQTELAQNESMPTE